MRSSSSKEKFTLLVDACTPLLRFDILKNQVQKYDGILKILGRLSGEVTHWTMLTVIYRLHKVLSFHLPNEDINPTLRF